MCFESSGLVVSSHLGYVKFAIQQCVSTQTCIGKKPAHLAVFDATCCATVLSLNSHRFVPLFEKPSLIDHQHRIGSRKHLTNIRAQRISHPVAIPLGPV